MTTWSLPWLLNRMMYELSAEQEYRRKALLESLMRLKVNSVSFFIV